MAHKQNHARPAGQEHQQKPNSDNNIIRAIQSFTKEYNATQKRNENQYNKSLHWTKRTTWWVAIYTIFTFIIMIASVYAIIISRASQRAFVVANDLSITPIMNADNTVSYWEVAAVIENAGNTSTRDLNVYSGVWWEDLSLYEKVPSLHPSNPDAEEWEFLNKVPIAGIWDQRPRLLSLHISYRTSLQRG